MSMTSPYEVKHKIEVLTANYPLSRDMIPVKAIMIEEESA
jgi:hypothetical protein